MRNLLSVRPRAFAFGILIVAVFVFGPAEARADEVTISGYTNGCFNCNPPPVPNTSATQTASLFGLSYVNASFNGETAGGFRGLGGNPQAPPIQNMNNLGGFQLASSLANYNGNSFTLRVTFLAPQGINGGATTLFTATLVGNVTSTAQGGVLIDFDNTPLLFTFTDTNCEGLPTTTCGTGSFFFSVNDLAISPGQIASLTGQITGATQTSVPEPMTLFLFGSGLAGTAAAVRRRRRRDGGV